MNVKMVSEAISILLCSAELPKKEEVIPVAIPGVLNKEELKNGDGSPLVPDRFYIPTYSGSIESHERPSVNHYPA